LLSGHFWGDFLAKQEHGVESMSREMASKSENKPRKTI
jgi:hypothetical protein